jgi:hypothetical protein
MQIMRRAPAEYQDAAGGWPFALSIAQLASMGGRMATNLQKAGFKLVVHDLHRQAARPSSCCRRHLGTARVRSQARPT